MAPKTEAERDPRIAVDVFMRSEIAIRSPRLTFAPDSPSYCDERAYRGRIKANKAAIDNLHKLQKTRPLRPPGKAA